jgi:formate-dependent nitrite reductase cytochrome c552 subunit
LSCHVTGWEPQRYHPFDGGFLALDKTPDLIANGCENCHGPGSAHVAAETGDEPATDELLAQLRQEMRLPYADAKNNCLQCHDLDNSPDFNFEKYWPEVEHKGKN